MILSVFFCSGRIGDPVARSNFADSVRNESAALRRAQFCACCPAGANAPKQAESENDGYGVVADKSAPIGERSSQPPRQKSRGARIGAPVQVISVAGQGTTT